MADQLISTVTRRNRIDYEVYLLGVTFFQMDGKIRCHSRRSIATLAEKVPTAK